MIRIADMEIDVETARLLGHEYCVKYVVFPFRLEDEHLWVALRDIKNMDILTNISDITGCFVVPVAADEGDILFHVNRIFGADALHSIASQFLVDEQLKNHIESSEILTEISSAPAVRLIDSLIETGVLNRASDIHIEPYGQQLRARYRVDGQLITYSTVDITLLPNVVSRLKIMGGMDISEKRLPQDGHFTMTDSNFFAKGDKVDFRLSTLPTVFGEKIVIRLLYGETSYIKKEALGFYDEDLKKLTALFNQPYGAIFMTGPTGSGKSTTLSSFLRELNHETSNIITVEDPVENPILGISHINIERTGLNFPGALRHILRQDPDVIMIGEIRDEETARIAIQAAITGHVVLSTLHTNDAAGVIERLTDMGIPSYLVAAALNGVISQRLVRRICQDCAYPTTLTQTQAQLLQLPVHTPVQLGRGCSHCNHTGFRSRFAIYEYIIINENIRRQISSQPSKFAEGIRSLQGLRNNAVRALIDGKTTADEIIRALSRENLAGEV
ncbi:MAG: GspE/PulE family protein [Defluviitaleaceae bacterium]|nr:GspE/PulE family protein [Defluviitaleaceae bacterium]